LPATIIGALLPIVVVLLLGFFGGWHKDFNRDQATVPTALQPPSGPVFLSLPLGDWEVSQVRLWFEA
jgi:hypothetical protein